MGRNIHCIHLTIQACRGGRWFLHCLILPPSNSLGGLIKHGGAASTAPKHLQTNRGGELFRLHTGNNKGSGCRWSRELNLIDRALMEIYLLAVQSLASTQRGPKLSATCWAETLAYPMSEVEVPWRSAVACWRISKLPQLWRWGSWITVLPKEEAH